MGEVVAWAVIGGVVALFTQRKGVAVMLGVATAVLGTVVKIAVVVGLAGALIGARASSGGETGGPVAVARAVAVVIFAACLVLLVALIGMHTRRGSPRDER